METLRALMAANGWAKHVIVHGDDDDFYNNPTFSPDGVRIAFAHWPLDASGTNSPSSEIWTARIDGAQRRPITDGSAFDNKPDWGPRPRHGH